MRQAPLAVALLVATVVLSGCAQPAAPSADPTVDQPYAGLDGAAIRGLRPEQVSELENATGMGLALPAELNGYPGPRHVLDHAGALGLSAAQHADVQAIWDGMHAEAVALGQEVLAAYQALDLVFRAGGADADAVRAAAGAVAEAEGRLRTVHLLAHLDTLVVLTPEQVAAYNALRGYTDGGADGGAGTGGHGGHGAHGQA